MNFFIIAMSNLNDYCIINCVLDHYLLIYLSNVFKTEFSKRYNIKLATRLSTNVLNAISMLSSSSKKRVISTPNKILDSPINQKP